MNEFNNKSKGELKKLLVEKRKALHDFRFAFAGGKVKNVKEGKAARKDIARIMTAISLHDKQEKVTQASAPQK
jgi:ribosomal protein L29